jgi:2-polyprenyl-3-methyl-5-hydroxy-6-metoxy-1,4-benzoquinol methylase
MVSSAKVEARRQEQYDEWPAEGLEWLGRCPLCQSTERSVLHRRLRDRVFFCAPGEWTLYACDRCQAGYLDPRPTTATIGRAYASYFTHHPAERPRVEEMPAALRWRRALGNGYRNWRYGTRDRPAQSIGVLLAHLLPQQRALLDLELRYLPHAWPGARVLDVGAGDGSFLRWAAAAGWDAVGVEPDPVAVAAARAHGLHVSEGTIEHVPAGQRFDAVTANHVIEHVHDPRRFLEHIRELLTPGGLLWLDTPNLAGVGHDAFGSSWLGLDPPRHLVLFTGRSLRAWLAATGFRVVRQLRRPEVCRVTYAASRRIEQGSGAPLDDLRSPIGLRLRASVAGWRVRFNRERAEFLTLIAVRDA